MIRRLALLLLVPLVARPDVSNTSKRATWACLLVRYDNTNRNDLMYLRLSTGERAWAYVGDTTNSYAQRFGNCVLIYDYTSGRVTALDRMKGREAWSSQVTNVRAITMTQAGVVIGHNAGAQLADASNGRVLWQYAAGSNVNTLRTDKERVYLSCQNGKIVCLGISNGAFQWEYWTSDTWPQSTTVGERLICWGGGESGRLACLDPRTGTAVWDKELGHRVSWATVNDNRLYVTDYNRHVTCLRFEDGAKLWEYTTDGSLYYSFAKPDRVLVSSRRTGRLVCLDALTGAERWTAKVDSENFYAYCLPALNRVVATDYADRKVQVFDLTTGGRVWELRSSVNNAYLYVEGKMGCMVTAEGEVTCVDMATGRELWKYGAPDRVLVCDPVESRVIVVTRTGVIALAISDGRKLWEFGVENPLQYAWLSFVD